MRRPSPLAAIAIVAAAATAIMYWTSSRDSGELRIPEGPSHESPFESTRDADPLAARTSAFSVTEDSLEALRRRGLELLREFGVDRMPLAPPAARVLRGEIGLAKRIVGLASLTDDQRIDELRQLLRRVDLIAGMEDLLVESVLTPAWHEEQRRVLAALLELDTSAARDAAVHLGSWQLAQVLIGAAPELLRIELERTTIALGTARTAEAAPLLAAIGGMLEDSDAFQDGAEALALEATAALASIETREAVAEVRKLLASQFAPVRRAAAEGAVRALHEGRGSLLARALEPWAREVVIDHVGEQSETRALAWLVFAGSDEASPQLLFDLNRQLNRESLAEYTAWIYAVTTACANDEASDGSRILRELLESPFAPNDLSDLGGNLREHVFGTFGDVAEDDDFVWFCNEVLAFGPWTATLFAQSVSDARWRGSVYRLEAIIREIEEAAPEYLELLTKLLFKLGRIDPDLIRPYLAHADPDVAADTANLLQELELEANRNVCSAILDEASALPGQQQLELLVRSSDPRGCYFPSEILQFVRSSRSACVALEGVLTNGDIAIDRRVALVDHILEARLRCGIALWERVLSGLVEEAWSGVAASSQTVPLSKLAALLAVLEGSRARDLVRTAFADIVVTPSDSKLRQQLESLVSFIRDVDAARVDYLY